MADLSRLGFDHWADNNEGVHNGFIELIAFAVAFPDVGTVEMTIRVSASCYRRLLAAALAALL